MFDRPNDARCHRRLILREGIMHGDHYVIEFGEQPVRVIQPAIGEDVALRSGKHMRLETLRIVQRLDFIDLR